MVPICNHLTELEPCATARSNEYNYVIHYYQYRNTKMTKKVGRPALDGKNESKIVTTRFPGDLWQKVKAAAKKAKVAPSSWLRKAAEEKIERDSSDEEKLKVQKLFHPDHRLISPLKYTTELL